ncbi:MAG TPA: ABC transporter substrate-binding protein [Alphaproteobacteria bacterium]|nr:ABC transporter substrate-binding protein [Alphaproteobacteria bacterium]
MGKFLSALLALAAGIVIGSFAGPAPAAAETIKIAHSTWVGYGPLYIAREKGIFKKNGVDVELVLMEDPKERFPTLMADKIQMISSTVDTALLYLKNRDDFQYVVAIDDSNGGDGIVANKDITSIKDLKGKKVAVNEGSVSEFYLNVLLDRAGLKESELNIVNMTAMDAGTAFVTKRVDAAVTWEPALTKGKTAEHGHLLVDSSSTPGLITDVIIIKSSWVKAHPKDVAAIVKSWEEAVAYYEAHPEESIEIMAKGVGGWLKDPKEFKETLTGIKFYDGPANKTFFGTAAKPGPLFQTTADAIKIWTDHGKLQVKVVPSDLINYSFVNG